MKLSSAVSLRFCLSCAGFCFLHVANAQLNERVLHSFSGGLNGQQPSAGLVQGVDGALYGTTYLGGGNQAGTIFKVSPDGSTQTALYQFEASPTDPLGLAYPSGLIQGQDGALYGTTGHGGAYGLGSVFKINPDGAGYSVLHSFSSSEGYQPTAALVWGRDGALYGTTQFGGAAGAGTVFKLNPNGTGFAQLYAFGLLGEDARSPQAPLLQGQDGALYGTTTAGGASAVGGASGYGAVFKINPDGTGYRVLHGFLPSGGDGVRPYGGLVQGGDGALYGTTQEGGAAGFGTVFKVGPDGSGYAVLHSFDPAAGEGKYPNSGVAIGQDGALYGTTEFGGSNNLGVVFKLAPNGSNHALLYSFGADAGDGSYPKAPLVRAADGGLFGTTQFGGQGNFGTIFRLGPRPAVLSSIRPLPDNTMQISLTGAAHFEYRIEASNDQVHWMVLTNLYNATGSLQFIDPQASRLASRFYRAAWVP